MSEQTPEPPKKTPKKYSSRRKLLISLDEDQVLPPVRTRATINQKQWDDLLDLFRVYPGKCTKVAKLAGTTAKRAWIAWHRGWSNPPWARYPIKEVLDGERVKARKALVEQSPREKDMIRLDAVEERVTQARAIRQVFQNAIALQAEVAQIAKSLIPVSREVAAFLERVAAAGITDLAICEKLVNIHLKVTYAQRSLAAAVKSAQEAAHLQIGKPEELNINMRSDTLFDPDAAFQRFGEDFLLKASTSLLAGERTPETESFLEWITTGGNNASNVGKA